MTGMMKKYLTGGYIIPRKILFIAVIALASGFFLRGVDRLVIMIFASYGIGANFFLQFLSCGITKADAIMPVKTARVELARYLSTLVLLGIVLVLGVIYFLPGYFTGAVGSFDMVWNNLAGVAGLFFWTGAVLFPTMRLLNANRNVLALTVIGVMMITVYIVITTVAGESRLFGDVPILAVAVGAFGLFVASYFLSLFAYRRNLRTKGVI